MQTTFQIRGELITWTRSSRAVGIASSGAHAKELVTQGAVKVDGEREPPHAKAPRRRGGGRSPEAGARIRLEADPAFRKDWPPSASSDAKRAARDGRPASIGSRVRFGVFDGLQFAAQDLADGGLREQSTKR